MSLKIAVIGMGAVGSLYASKLQIGGAKIVAFCRSNYELVANNGLRIKDPDQQYSKFMPDTVLSYSEPCVDEFDLVLVATKVLPEIDSITRLKTLKFKAILLLQNGIFIEDEIKQQFPDKTIISGLAFVCVSRPELGLIHHQDYGALSIGDYPNGVSPITREIANCFKKANTKCFVTESIMQARFKKLCWNIPFNCLSVTEGGVTTQALLAIPGMETRIKQIMKEVQLISKAADAYFDDEVIFKHIDDTKKMVNYKTSMLVDFEANRAIESEAILGNAIRYAKSKKLNTPELDNLYAKINTL